MQMYRVKYQTHYGNTIERGDVLICASNKQTAIDMMLNLLQLPGSRTQCEVTRVRPAIFELERRAVKTREPRPSLRNQGRRL